MPVMHVVTFTFAPEAAEEVMVELAAALDDLAPRTKAIRYRHGPDIGVRDGNAHYAVTALFEDRNAFQDYIADPEHQQIIREKITPHLRSRSAVQFDVPPDGSIS
jgi:Stress responsive A/B Barrel Domain